MTGVPELRQIVEVARNYVETGRLASAGTLYRAILNDTVDLETGIQRIARGEACLFFANQAVHNTRYGEACDWYHAALTADPLAVEYRLEYIQQALLPIDMINIARLEARRACDTEPGNAHCWRTAAAVEREANDAAAAQRFLDRAFECGPEDGATLMYQAALWADLGRFDEALAMFARVEAALQDQRAEVLHNYGIIHERMGQEERAIEYLDEALAIGTLKDPVLAGWNRAGMLLTVGRYAEGWPLHGMAREDQRQQAKSRRISPRQAAGHGRLGWRFKAPWFTLDTPPCRVHVHPEQGWGDVLCMSRYLPAIRDMGHDVRFEVEASMVDLFRESPSFAGITVLPKAIDYPGALGLPEFDVHAMTMEMPGLFGATLDNLPLVGGWLGVSDERRRAASYAKAAVGICWSSGIREGFWLTEYGKRKSMGRANAEKLMSMHPELSWFEFDFDARPASFADTAAELLNLDLLVTADTAIAHLAGALGVPTWIAMHPQGSWHWMKHRGDSPWYRSVRLFRTERPHEWDGVLSAISDALDRR